MPPINCLPPEVLVKVLEFRELDQDLLVATHVCRYWRSTLISAPCLWTLIPCYDMNRVSTFLERSKSAPIDVLAVIRPRISPNDSALELVIPHLGRVRSLRVRPISGGTLPSIFRFRSPAPILQHLEISGYPHGQISRLPRNFLGCHVPSLRSLIWDDSSLMPESLLPLIPTHPQPYDPDEAPTPLLVVLGLLSSTPYLEHLSISILDEDVAPDSTPVHDIYLGSLRKLKLVSGVALSRVIPHFKAPELKELLLILPPGVGTLTIADLFPSDSYPLLTNVTWMDFYAGPGDGGIKFMGEGVKIAMNAFFPRTEAINDFFPRTAYFSFAQITKLVLRMVAGPLAARVGEFTNLERLELIRCEEDAEVLCALSPSPRSVPRVPCPHLTAMRIAFYNPTTHVVDSLRQMVRLRKEAGSPLVTIDFMYFDRMYEILDIDALNEWLGQPPLLE